MVLPLNQTTATNYLATTGTMWVNDNDGYIHDIAGIGKDDCQDLHQKQSKSVNSDALVTIAVGDSIMPTNAVNTASINNDLSFLVWANNNADATSYNTAVSVSGVQATSRLARVWKVDKTNFDNQDITLNFSNYTEDTYLLISTDPTFATVTDEFILNAAGNITFSSADLPHGAYFTFGKRIAGPNCVNSGVLAWLRADIGANGIDWTDYSGNNNNPTATGYPDAATTTYINFNPAFYYDGNDGHTLPASADLTTGNYSIMTVSKMEGSQNGRVFQSANGNKLMGYHGGTENRLYIEGWLTPLVPTATTEVKMYSLQRTNSGAYEFRDKNKIILSGPSSNGSTWRLNIGGTSTYFEASKVYVPEVAIYSTDLSATDVNKIESYFAIKYGVTLDQTTGTDYLASDGSVYWNDSDNTGYNNDITGIGRDDCTNLNQKQSRSANTDDVITMAVGTSLAATNAANAATITNDKSFLVWSNDNGATAFSPTVSGFTNATTRMSRIWKVDKTNNFANQDITICASQAGERYLLLSADATFGAGDVEKTFNFSTGCLTLNSSELGDGSYFTIATKIVGPACVNSGIALWMRADYNGTATSWSDFSGNSRNTTGVYQSWTPNSTGANFNPYLNSGAAAAYYNLAGIYSSPGIVNTKIFTVALPVQSANNLSYSERTTNGDNIRLLYSWSDGNMYWDAPFGYRVVAPFVSNGGTYSVPNLFVGERSQTNMAIRLNGKTAINNNAAYTGTFTTGAGAFAHIGADWGWATHANNRIAEVVVYKDASAMTPVEIQRIESYLALKYGITLNTNTDGDGTSFELLTGTNPSSVTEGDYVASNGTTIYWDASANTGYNAYVAGIGRDDCTDLYQKQSKSVNTGEILTGALGSTVAASNAANTNTGASDQFGRSVAISGDGNTAAVGANYEDGSNSGINPVSNNSASNAGAVYVFTRSGSVWSAQATIKASNPGGADEFGIGVALSTDGNTLAVGARLEDGSGIGINPVVNNSAADAGAAYIFSRSGTTWSQQAYIKAPNTGGGDHFGWSVDLSGSGDNLVVGAIYEDGSGTLVNSLDNNSAADAGAAYIYTRSGSSWTSTIVKLKASNTGASDLFGWSVSISQDGKSVVVGAPREDAAASSTCVNPLDNNSAVDAGSIYQYYFDAGVWSYSTKFKAGNAGASDYFGFNVSQNSNGKSIAIGAPYEDSSTTGINPTNNNSAANSGAVYVFTDN